MGGASSDADAEAGVDGCEGQLNGASELAAVIVDVRSEALRAYREAATAERRWGACTT